MGMSEYMKDIRNKVGHTLLQMPSVTIINFDETGRVLLVKHRDTDLWVAPGGAVEPGEIPADAAVREMWEETGLVVELVGIVGVYGGPEFVVEYSNGDRTSYVTTVFEGRVVGGTLEPVDDESSEAAYFSREEVMALDTQPWVPV
ncbi:MAG: DNA mismatch repair protein MutT [Candidatus Zixiibacteriota bacterium]|nr:MAG: DNA mismatch repair protein MutT [candidate division Zixibacteria bacterium]